MTIAASVTPILADEVRRDALLPKGTRFGPIHIAVRTADPFGNQIHIGLA